MCDGIRHKRNMTEQQRQITPSSQRLPLTLNRIETLAAVLASVATWFGFRHLLQTYLPYPCGMAVNDIVVPCRWTYENSWNSLGRPIFIVFVLPLIAFLSISAIALIRIVRKDVGYFSTFGLFALAWPLVSFPLLHVLYPLFCYCLPAGAIAAGVKAIDPDATKRKPGDWIAVVFNVVWSLFVIIYFGQLLNTYGD